MFEKNGERQRATRAEGIHKFLIDSVIASVTHSLWRIASN